MSSKKLIALFSMFLILALVLAACGGDEEEATATPEPEVEVEAPEEEDVPDEEEAADEEPADEEPMEEMAELDVPTIPGGFLEQALTGEFAGTTVTFDGPFADIDQVLFEESIAPFEEATGIDINYIGDKEFEARVAIAVDGGNAPDIADFPQPGTVAGFARQGHLVDVSDFIPEDWLQQQYNQSWLDMATMEGPDGEDMMAGTWYRMNTKSQVFYPKAQFDAAGYEVPETWEELVALTQLIADDGDTAWCIGIESGAGTGWPATDWTEETMLRTTSLDNYDAWVEGTLPFDSPEVREAIETWSEIWFNPDYVFGGTDGIVTTNFGDSPAAMFEDPPRCWLHKQGNFITGFFPEGNEYGEDWDMFYLPPIGDELGRPFLVAGDINVMFNDRPEVRAVMEFMTVPESAIAWLQNGGALASHKTATPDMYGQEVERGFAELVNAASSFRFDGSDLMPGEVGAGSFWTGMVDYVSGAADLDTVLPEIDASWPEGVSGEVQEEGAAPPDEAGAVSCEEPVKVGLITDQTGALAAYGAHVLRSFPLGLEYATGAAGTEGDGYVSYMLDGCEIQVFTRDDGSNPETTATMGRELIEVEGVDILAGTVSSGATATLQELARENNVILVVAPAAANDITGVNFNENTFRTSRNNYQDAVNLCEHLVTQFDTFVSISPDYAFGYGGAEAFRDACTHFGGEFVADDIFAPLDTTEFTPYIEQILDSGAEAWIANWAGAGFIPLFQAVADLGVSDEMTLGASFIDNTFMPVIFPNAVGETGGILYHYTLPDNAVNDWLVEAIAAQGAVPDLFDADAMNAALLIATGLEATGGDASAEALISVFEGLEFEGPKGTIYIRPEDHVAVQDMYIVNLLNLDDPEAKFFELVKTNRPDVPCLLPDELSDRCGDLSIGSLAGE